MFLKPRVLRSLFSSGRSRYPSQRRRHTLPFLASAAQSRGSVTTTRTVLTRALSSGRVRGDCGWSLGSGRGQVWTAVRGMRAKQLTVGVRPAQSRRTRGGSERPQVCCWPSPTRYQVPCPQVRLLLLWGLQAAPVMVMRRREESGPGEARGCTCVPTQGLGRRSSLASPSVGSTAWGHGHCRGRSHGAMGSGEEFHLQWGPLEEF